jgi:uncharacterized membrane-anchored protein
MLWQAYIGGIVMSSMRDFAPHKRDDKPRRHDGVLPAILGGTIVMAMWLGIVYMFVLELTA